MDFYEEASLVMVPSGYKDQKVYSSVPDDGSGDLTFTRASNATRVGPDGLIEKVRTNLLTYSNTFNNVDWVNSNITLTSGQQDPFGGTTGWRYLMTSIGASYLYYNSVTINAAEMTISFWVKSNTGSSQTFVSTANSGSQSSPTFTATTSWQRFSWTFTSSAGGSNILLAYNATTNCDLLIYGAQFETGVMTDYIATTTAAVSVGPVANVPRLDYLGSTCPKLLLEGQRTNALTYSEQIDNAAWTKVLASSLANDTTSPDGYTNADKIRPNSGVTFSIPASGIYTAGASSYIRSSGLTLTAASYTFSAFVKKGEYDYIQLRSGTSIDTTANGSGVTVNLNNGTTTATSGYSIEDYGDGWYRISHTFTATATTWYLNFWFWNSTSVTANGTDGVYVYGAQLEEGAYATSYIPTLGAAVTRLADVASKTGISSLIGQTEGVLFYDFVWNGATTSTADYPIVLSGSDFNNFIGLNTTFNSNQLLAYSGGVPVASIAGSDFVIGQRYKIALAYKANDFVYYVNGTLQGSDTSGAVPIGLANLQMVTPFGSKSTVQNANSILFFQTRLSNADLATLTTL
jgi:hypothetical protein